jgi:ankyrin repeat protein
VSATKEQYITALKNDEHEVIRHENSRSIRNHEKVSPLVLATSFGSVRCIDVLIELGMKPDEADCSGNTPLHHASSAKAVKKLLEHGADPNARNEYGYTPLHLIESPAAIKALIKLGADPNMSNNRDKTTPLMFACKHGQTARMKALLQSGADPNALGEHGENGICLLLFGTEVPTSRKEKGISLLIEHGMTNPRSKRVKELIEMGWETPSLEKLLSGAEES